MLDTDKKNKQLQYLRKITSGQILIEEPLLKHTSFKIGGPADYYIYPKGLNDLKKIIEFCIQEEITLFVIGNGTNLLVNDDGFNGMIIDLSRTFTHIKSKDNSIIVGSGVSLSDFQQYCLERGFSGLEPLIGIPGQIGGGINLNAGAFGTEILNHLESVKLLDENCNLITRRKDEIKSGYRHTDIPPNDIIVEAQFVFAEGNPKIMEATQQNYLKKRREQQPLSLPSAGSVFKRPPGDYAGRLIEDTGCKGLRIGDAMVSKKHANFIVNCNLASAQDVLRLIDEVKERVFKRFAVELEIEIHLCGF
jgi:UDP-N-acetylmuramate dehydrogenase